MSTYNITCMSLQCYQMMSFKVQPLLVQFMADRVSRATEAMPGTIRKAEFFVSFMRRFNEYLKV